MRRHFRTALMAFGAGMAAMPAAAFEVSFDFSNVPPCAGGALRIVASPEFRLADVPEGAQRLDFFLTDLTAGFEHRGREIDYEGGDVVPEDSFRYLGPCPWNGTHLYEWRVRALDADGVELGVAFARQEFTASR